MKPIIDQVGFLWRLLIGQRTSPSEWMEPRLNYIDLDLVNRVRTGREKTIEQFEENERYGRHKLPQTSYALAFDDYVANAFYKYALGEPLDEVRAYLGKAAACLERVFELRGTQPPFPVTVVTTDSGGNVIDRRPLHPEGTVDFSTTNPVDGLTGLYLALIVGDVQLTRHIAEMIWDPPDATYIGSDSEVCTLDEQHLAYALKYLVLRKDQAALAEIDAIDPEVTVVYAFGSQRDIKRQAIIINAILHRDHSGILAGLKELVQWHARVARLKSEQNNPRFFLSTPGLGLFALARAKGIVNNAFIDSVYLPTALIVPIEEGNL